MHIEHLRFLIEVGPILTILSIACNNDQSYETLYKYEIWIFRDVLLYIGILWMINLIKHCTNRILIFLKTFYNT